MIHHAFIDAGCARTPIDLSKAQSDHTVLRLLLSCSSRRRAMDRGRFEQK